MLRSQSWRRRTLPREPSGWPASESADDPSANRILEEGGDPQEGAHSDCIIYIQQGSQIEECTIQRAVI